MANNIITAKRIPISLFFIFLHPFGIFFRIFPGGSCESNCFVQENYNIFTVVPQEQSIDTPYRNYYNSYIGTIHHEKG